MNRRLLGFAAAVVFCSFDAVIAQSDLTLYRTAPYARVEAVVHNHPMLKHALDREVNVDFDATPLSAAIAKLGEMAGTNIALDGKALRLLGIDPNLPVRFRACGIPIRSAMAHILEPLQLTCMPTAERWVVTDTVETAYELRTSFYPIADLMEYPPKSGKGCVFQLMAAIQCTVAADSWADNGGTGNIDYCPSVKAYAVTQTEANHQQLEDMLSAVRAACDYPYYLTAGSPPEPPQPAIFVGADRSARLDRLLEKKIDVDFQNVPLRAVLDRLSAEAGTEILVDRKGIAELKCNEPVTLKVRQTSIRCLLKLILDDLGLSLLQHADCWVVMEAAEAQKVLTTRVYPVADLVFAPGRKSDEARPAEFMSCVEGTIAIDTWADNGGLGAIDYVPTAMALVVTQIADVHAQLVELLAALRKAREYRYDLVYAHDREPPYPAVFVGQERFLELERLIDRRIDIDFRATPLQQALAHLSAAAQTEFILAGSGFPEARSKADAPVTLQAKQISIRSALSLILDEQELSLLPFADHWKIVNADDSEQLTTRVYPIADLTRNYRSDLVKRKIFPQFLYFLQTVVDDVSWADNGGTGCIEYLPTLHSLIVTQSPGVHQKLADIFRQLRESRKRTYEFEVRPKEIAKRTAPEPMPPSNISRLKFHPLKYEPSPLERILRSRISVDFERAPIRQVVAELRQLGVPLTLDPESARAEGETLERLMTLQMNDVTLRSVAYWTARAADWQLTHGNQKGQMLLYHERRDDLIQDQLLESSFDRRYDVAALIALPNTRKSIMNMFLATIQSIVATDTWSENGGAGKVVADERMETILATQTGWVHGLLECFLVAMSEVRALATELTAKARLPDLENVRQIRRMEQLDAFAESAATGTFRYQPGCFASLPSRSDSLPHAALERRVTASFQATPLSNVLATLGSQANVKFAISRRGLKEAEAGDDPLVTQSLRDLPLCDALVAILKQHPLGFAVEDQVIQIVDAASPACLSIRIYPVADLIIDRKLHPARLFAELQLLDENAWEEKGGAGRIGYSAATCSLFVLQTEDMHRQSAARLEQLRGELGP